MRKKLLNLCMTALLSVVTTAAWALSDSGGVYQIGSAADLEEFATLVNEGQVYANAVLTADIDRGIDGTMIGTVDNKYQGFFDGKGHTIKINMFPEDQSAALFRYTGYRCVIQNLKVEGTITTGNKFAAGLVAENNGIIRGCYIDVTIKSSVAGDATHGGIVGRGYGGTTVENCLAKITILGEGTQNCGGVVGWANNRTNIVNCLAITDGSTIDLSTGLSCNISRNPGNLKVIDVDTYNADPYANRPQGASYNNYVTNQWGDNVATTVVPYEDLADGRICYQLNNDQSRIAWVQRIGTDPFPVPAAFGSGQVYASGSTNCDGLSEAALTYSNSGSDGAAKHTFDKYGVCTTCGCFDFHMFDFEDPTQFDKTDMSVLVGSVTDIDKVEGWNRIANGFRLNMKMTSDIEYITEPGKYIFNNSDWIDGNFNGQGHTFTIGMTDMGDRAALFPEMAGNVENLIVHGSIETSGTRWGSIVGEARMALVRNVYSDVDITSSNAGDNTAGGFFGWMGDLEKTVENCIYVGDITLPEDAPYVRVGGFAGWSATKTYFKNCAVLGNITGAGDQSLQSSTENSGNISRNWSNIECTNVYVVNPITGRDIADQDKYIHYENTAGIASGELAFFLNGKQNGLERFFQVIGTDPEPMPFPKDGGLIYSASTTYRCDGTPLGGGGYTNNPSGEAVIPPHNFVDGFCTVCGQMDENFLAVTDGFYEINNGLELRWWSIYASQHPDASAKLMDDIDMSGNMEGYIPVVGFTGTFDGQGHTISNFVIDNTSNNQGLIGEAHDGAVVQNLILDNTCSIEAGGYAGIIGNTSSNGGTIYVTNVGFEGNVGVDGYNAAGIVGCCSGGAMAMIITNCWVTGTITKGAQSAAICGYSGGSSIITNCWSTCKMDASAIYDCDSFTRGSGQVVNCYEADIEGVDPNKQQHYRQMGANRATITLPLEDVASGALCYNLNGKQFREPTWFQTIDDDAHPYPFDNHGVVVFGADQYFSTPNSSLNDIVSVIESADQETLDGVIATKSVLDEWQAALDVLSGVETLEALADAMEAVEAAKAVALANAAVYQAYIDECERVKAYLAEHNDFAGDLRDALDDYLSEVEEPDADNPLGTYEYIVDVHTATAEEIKAETERVTKWLQDAIQTGYIAGTDVSNLISNSDFSQQNEYWTGGFINSLGTTTDDGGNTVYGVEAWNMTGDMYQTVEGMKPGYYLVGVNGAFRPSNNRYSHNYAAGIYANGIFNYFPAAIEDYVAVDDAVDGVNCNLTIKSAYDMEIFDDYYSTSDEFGAMLLGYIVQGETGMAIAAKAGRYQAYTIAKVAEDGKLTVGIKNPGTNYGSDWTGWGPLKITYLAEEADDALTTVLTNMSERANTLVNDVDYLENVVLSGEPAGAYPNYPQELRDQLQNLIDEVEGTEGVEAKAALAKRFSDLFQAIYEGKQAYVSLYNYAASFDLFQTQNLALVEKDEDGEWFDTGENLFTDDEVESTYSAADPLFNAFADGSFSTEQALNPIGQLDAATAAIVKNLMPAQDSEGYYLISNRKQFAAYRAIASEIDRYAKGKLTADIDMDGVAMLPIGHNRGENAQHIFAGEFDGQGHALENVYIDDTRIPSGEYAEPATLFYELQNATAKNFKLTGEFYTSHQFSGAITRWMSGKSTIDNCEIAVAMHFAENLKGDASSGGVIGRNGSANSLINNCLVNCTLIGEGEEPIWYVGGVAGWADAALIIKNTLILSEYENVGADGDNSRTISRGTKCTPTNVFVSQFFREAEGTLVTPEQLASGEIAYKLNGSSSDNPFWFQTLGVEETPHLFDGSIVYRYAGEYTNDEPNPQLNAYAFNLNANVVGDNVVVKFYTNAEAEAISVEFTSGETSVYSQSVSGTEFPAGPYAVKVPVSALKGNDPTTLSYAVSVTGKGTLETTKVGKSYKVWGPYGMAVNNNPASAGFGQLLVAESWVQPYVNGDNHYISENKVGALYAFDAGFQPINAADGTPGFYGGLGIKDETPLEIIDGNCFDLKDIRFSKDGRLFVARASGLSNSSVWEINPEDLDEPWKPIFKGGELDEATGITYVGSEEQNRMAISLALEGEGNNLKMYVLGGQRSNGSANTTDYNCAIYDLGTATEWTTAPSGYVIPLDGVYTNTSSYVGIQTDGQGGLWFISNQHSAETPALAHFDATGNEDYLDIATSTNGCRIAVTPDGNYLAIPMGSGKIVIYETNYVPMENGKIYLEVKQTINVGETTISSLAFDWAGNLYVASGGTETLSRYAIPTSNKVVVTPGNAIGLAVQGDVNGDGKVTVADYTYVLNMMADETYAPNADVNSDGEVTVADATMVLNIMADQE